MSYKDTQDVVIGVLRLCTPTLYPDVVVTDPPIPPALVGISHITKRSNVTEADDSIIDTGVSAFAICYPGAEDVPGDLTSGEFGRIYEIKTILGVRYTNEKDTMAALVDLIDLVNLKFAQYPHGKPIAKNIIEITPNGHGEVSELPVQNTKSIAALWVEMSILAEYRSRVTGGEFR